MGHCKTHLPPPIFSGKNLYTQLGVRHSQTPSVVRLPYTEEHSKIKKTVQLNDNNIKLQIKAVSSFP